MADHRRIDPFVLVILIGGIAFSSSFGGCSRKAKQPAVGAKPAAPGGVAPAASGAKEKHAAEIPTTVEPFTLGEKEYKIDLAPGIVMEFVGIPPGSFMMGNNRQGIRRHEEKITKPFYLGKYEVTQEQWQAVMGTTPSLHKGPPKRPVERINWDDCQAFLQKLNEKFGNSGMRFGLPTEAQWEWACRAGATLRIDSTDNPDKIEEYAWLGTNSGLETHPVGEKKPNKWGLYDMHGNVAEWCADNATNMADSQLPEGAGAGGDFHVVRGGAWRDAAREATSMTRVLRRDTVSLRFDGLRVLCEPK